MKKLLVFIICLFPFSALADSYYGHADFSRSDYWSRDGLVEHWIFDPGTTGDIWEQIGDMELWNNVDCPQSFSCQENGDSTIDDETTEIYSKNTSVKFTTDAVGSVLMLSTYHTLEANKCYQWIFYTKGDAGTEDLLAYVTDPSGTIYYDFATDTWGGLAFDTLTDIGTDWTRHVYFINTGASDRTNYRFYVQSVMFNNDETSYIDKYELNELKSCTVVGQRGNQLSNVVTSDPLSGHSEVGMQRTGTGPAYKRGMQLDGTDDSLECADGTCSMDPVNWDSGGSFSVACRFIPDNVSGSHTLLAKYGAAGSRSWLLYQSNDDFIVTVSNDGTTTTSVSDANTVVANGINSFVYRYSYVGNAAVADGYLRLLYNTESHSAAQLGPPFDTGTALTVGQFQDAAYFSGHLLECAVWDRTLTDIERDKWITPYCPKTNHGNGYYIDTCTQATAPATCSREKCIDGVAAACTAEGTGVLSVFDQYTELQDNNSFETISSGGDSSPDFANWTETENPNGGTSAITAYRAQTRHWLVSARMKIGGWDSGYTPCATLDGECQTTGIGSDVTFCAALAKLSQETAYVNIGVVEYSDGACTTQVALTWLQSDVDPSTVWHEYCSTHAAASWDGTTASYQMRIFLFDGDQDVLVDTVSIKEASYRTPWVHNPNGTGTLTYSTKLVTMHNPLYDYSSELNERMFESGFCFGSWVYTDWAGDDSAIHTIYTNAEGVNIVRIDKYSSNNLYFWVEGSDGLYNRRYLSANSVNWPAGDWKYLEWCQNNNNTSAARIYVLSTETWYSLPVASVWVLPMDDISSTVYIGSWAGANFFDGYFGNICIGPYSAVYPQMCWNNGKPPVNGTPY